jgi:NADH-quinone oxidoreductase subunit L
MSINFLLENPWILLAFPLISFVIVGLIIRPLSGKLAAIVATTAVFFSFLCALAIAYGFFSGEFVNPNPGKLMVPWSFEWLRFQPGLDVHFGFILDPISAMMLVVVTTISLLVHIYSIGYMHGDPGYGRFFTYLNLFTFSMLGLVIAPNIFQMYVFWELVGVSSFLLIGFYYQKPSAVAASKKAFIVTRFADLGFLVGILIFGYLGLQAQQKLAGTDAAFAAMQALDFSFLTHHQVLAELSNTGWLGVALVLIYMGAAGKSAMFPLHIWLPDAMEGPTPVSALIHAATMVVAGVYMVARMFPAFSAAPSALELVSWVGLFTSAFAAVIACTQDDIKRVLAFSTLSQLGYMMFALGVASLESPLGYTASMFHLFTHAFFKALLFLGAGAVIHAVHTNNVWEMGGLRKKMPVTHATFMIAVLAIAGIWPLAGFFSKDEILTAALEGGHYVHFVGGLIVAGLTSFYMARIYFLTFWGKGRTHATDHAHEAPFLMLFPLFFLAVMSIVAGWIPFAQFVHPLSAGTHGAGAGHEHHGMNWTVVAFGTSMAVIGLFTSWFLYAQNDFNRVKSLTANFQGVYTVIKKKFYFDEIYLFITHQIIFRFIAAPISWFDRNVVDGAVNLSGEATQKSSALVTLIQTGQLQTYGVWFVIGTATTIIFFWMSFH